MRRILNFNQGIISGEIVREILDLFPEIEDKFRQRKNYDEYYFDGAILELNIEKIAILNDLGYSITLNSQEIFIS